MLRALSPATFGARAYGTAHCSARRPDGVPVGEHRLCCFRAAAALRPAAVVARHGASHPRSGVLACIQRAARADGGRQRLPGVDALLAVQEDPRGRDRRGQRDAHGGRAGECRLAAQHPDLERYNGVLPSAGSWPQTVTSSLASPVPKAPSLAVYGAEGTRRGRPSEPLARAFGPNTSHSAKCLHSGVQELPCRPRREASKAQGLRGRGQPSDRRRQAQEGEGRQGGWQQIPPAGSGRGRGGRGAARCCTAGTQAQEDAPRGRGARRRHRDGGG
eukprot:scaffold88107_cov67-Phaeocystis_antarctica.AAC.5